MRERMVSLLDELNALAVYLKCSGADAETKIEYGASKLEMLADKYKGDIGDEPEACKDSIHFCDSSGSDRDRV